MKFHCTYCGHAIESASGALGDHVGCSGCGAEVPIPQMPSSPKPALAKPVKDEANLHGWGGSVRRVFLFSLLACFIVGAATAILALLSANFEGTQLKILLSTLSLGFYSITGLCCALLADKTRFQIVGGIGIAISVAGALFAVLTNWEFITGWEVLIQGRFAFFIIAFAFAHSSLLLLIKTTNKMVRTCRIATLSVILLLALLLLATTFNPISLENSWQIIGVLGVLVALGTIATPIMHMASQGKNAESQPA